MKFEELFAKLEEEDVPTPSDDDLNKMAHQLLTESVADKDAPDNSGMVKKIASAVLEELKRAGVVKSATDINAGIPSNENSPNPHLENPVDAPPAVAQPTKAPQTGLADAMQDPTPANVAASSADPARAAATSAEVTIEDPEEAELIQKELEVVTDTASRLLQDGITEDPVAALAAASLAAVEDSLDTDESEDEAATDAIEETLEALVNNAAEEEKLSEIIESYGRVHARDLVKEYLRNNLLD